MGKQKPDPLNESSWPVTKRVVTLTTGPYSDHDFILTENVMRKPCVRVGDEWMFDPKVMRWYAERLIEAANLFDK
jgi:hypothetical protein